MMQFYMTPGSCSTGIHILLEELELVFAANIVNLPAGEQYSPEFLAINPKGTIPVLVPEEGRPLTEFISIAWWLAGTYPEAGLVPKEVGRQTALLELMSYVVSTIHQQAFTRIFVPEQYSCRDEDRLGLENQGRALAAKGFQVVAAKLPAAGGYLFDTFSVADAALFYVEFWADRIDLKLPGPCRAHFETMLKRPVVRRVLMEEGYRL
jgi:glutathione S-transferase